MIFPDLAHFFDTSGMIPGESESDFLRRRAHELRDLSKKPAAQGTMETTIASQPDLPDYVIQELTDFTAAFAETMPVLDQQGLFDFLNQWKHTRKLQPGDHAPEINWQE